MASSNQENQTLRQELQTSCGEIKTARNQQLRVLRHGQGVQVDNAEYVVVFVLLCHPILDGAQIITNMQITTRLNTGKDSFFIIFHIFLTISFIL